MLGLSLSPRLQPPYRRALLERLEPAFAVWGSARIGRSVRPGETPQEADTAPGLEQKDSAWQISQPEHLPDRLLVKDAARRRSP